MSTTSKQVAAQARAAGYEVLEIDQLRPNRWLLAVTDSANVRTVMLVVQRALVSASDVHDLGDLLRLRHINEGMLLVLDGKFSPVAQRTALEIRSPRILLCQGFPSASVPTSPATVLSTL